LPAALNSQNIYRQINYCFRNSRDNSTQAGWCLALNLLTYLGEYSKSRLFQAAWLFLIVLIFGGGGGILIQRLKERPQECLRAQTMI